MFGGIHIKLGGNKTREVIIRVRLMMASVRYMYTTTMYQAKQLERGAFA